MDNTQKINKKIPCTVAILTRNNEKTIEKALLSAVNFGEILICDGGSTDKTLSIAEQYGAKIIKQSSEFLDDKGRLTDYSGVRNQMLKEARYDWQFHLDSDEYFSDSLVSEVSEVVIEQTRPNEFVFLVPRQYEHKGIPIERSINYPSYQYRFFNRKHVTNFTKKIHERIRFPNGVKVGKLEKYQIIPLSATAEELWRKYVKYIALEIEMRKNITFYERAKTVLVLLLRVAVLLVRLFSRRILRAGTRLPLKYDFNYINYQAYIAWYLITYKK